jgi:metallo-beta-lactamase family protein
VLPLYRKDEVEAVVPRLSGVRFREPVALGPGVSARFLEAGHILGAAIIELTVRSDGAARRLVFSGDLGQYGAPIVPDPLSVEEADLLVMESTYGDRDHGPKTDVDAALADVITDTVRRGGNLLIPTFAIERAQELLLRLGELLARRRVPPVRVFLDSPMAADATEIYQRYPEFMDEPTRSTLRSGSLTEARGLLSVVRTADESKALNSIRGSCIIMAGSGMCTGGRIKHHLLRNIGRPESTVLFVAYQAEGTLGRQIVDGAREVRILGENFRVAADVRRIDGMSGHADRGQLLTWLRRLRRAPGRLALTHGDEPAALALAERIRADLGWEASVPRYLDEIEL